jgi:hypothetical protein
MQITNRSQLVNEWRPEMFGGNQRNISRDAATQQTGKKPKAEDFTGEAVSKAVLKETLEHPATIYPVAGSALAVAWTVMVAASPTSVAFALGCAFVGASAFIYNYVIKGPDRAAAYVTKLRELRRSHSLIEIEQFALECSRNGLVEGARGARELKSAYISLTDYLSSHKEGIAADRFGVLAEDTFQEGVSILQQALAIYKAIEVTDIAVLQKDLDRLKRQRASLDPKSQLIKSVDVQMEAAQHRIDLEIQQQNQLAQLFAQASEIEAALQSTYIELIDMQSHNQLGALNEDGGAANRLKSAVDVARRVERKLRGDDSESQAKRDKYLQAYENSTGIASSDKNLNGKFSGNLDFNPLARNHDHDQNQDRPHDQSRDQPRDQSREEQQ